VVLAYDHIHSNLRVQESIVSNIFFEGAKYSIAPGESVLDALIRGGANVEFSCRKGTCQICMLEVEKGGVGPEGVKGLRQALVEAKMFLPCCAQPQQDVTVKRPDLSKLYVNLYLAEKEWLSETICKLSFEPETNINWSAGQFVNLRRSDGVVRSYSIASIAEEDYYLTIHVKRIEDGVLSNWLCDELSVGDRIDGQGPIGTCFYEADSKDRNLLFLATGTGLSPLWGVCRDALRQGHTGEIYLYHSSKYKDGLYLRNELQALDDRYPNFHYAASLTREDKLPEGVNRGRIVELAFKEHPHIEGWMVYLCGIPEMVHEARCRAILAGVVRPDIRADPFEYAHRYMPNDSAKIASIEPDPELWEALENGKLLLKILTAFYDKAYQDPRLSPFFHKVTKRRAIDKQYAFLSDLFVGKKEFFGMRPFNAHHWMVISDELFDYREAMMEPIIRAHGVPEHLIRRWNALHETFRREIVKSSARGMIIDGKEHPIEEPEEVAMDFGTVCDGCHREIPAGATARFHPRGGELFCANCSAVPAA
jgi:ferredoxin-NADP reductase/ferredoxin/truncated hemoglobin YjbI